MTKRVLGGFLLITLFVLAVLEIPLGIAFADRQTAELTTQVERDAFFLASAAEDHLEDHRPLDLGLLARTYGKETGARVVITDADGVVLADSHPVSPPSRSMASRPEIATALEGRVARGKRHSSTLGTDLVYVAVPVATGSEVHGAVRITFTTAEIDKRIRRYWLSLGLVAVVSLAGATVVGVALARSVSRPLRRVEEAATAFGHGDLDSRAPTSRGPKEVTGLAVAFNDTADRLTRVIHSQEAFVADASHQLRTPLTALRLRLENLEPSVDAEGVDDLAAAEAETARLSRLVDGLLALARADRAGAEATRTVLRLDEVLQDRRTTWEPLTSEHDVSLVVEPGLGPTCFATRDRIDQVLDNLIANAIDVSPPGSTITLRATRRGDRVALHVVDQGPGMDDEEIERAFDRFWRADAAGNGALGGSGLGLSIARKLAEADGGSLVLGRADTGGLDAVVLLRPAEA